MWFLFIFKPFGIRISEGKDLFFLGICACFGAITSAMYLLFYGAVQYFSTFLPTLQEQNWTVWKEILCTALFVSVLATANMVFNNYYFDQPSLFQYFWVWQKHTLSLGFFPITMGAFYVQKRLSRKNRLQSAHINELLTKETSLFADGLLTLVGDNKNERLDVYASQLLYIRSTDNYVTVFYVEKENVKSTILRLSLKKTAAQLAAFTQFYKCHRTYIVNLGQVIRLSGNAQGHKLHLAHGSELIPVSRSLNEKLVGELSQKASSHSPQILDK